MSLLFRLVRFANEELVGQMLIVGFNKHLPESKHINAKLPDPSPDMPFDTEDPQYREEEAEVLDELESNMALGMCRAALDGPDALLAFMKAHGYDETDPDQANRYRQLVLTAYGS